MARCTSAAATAESTPPDSAHSARRAPTRARVRSPCPPPTGRAPPRGRGAPGPAPAGQRAQRPPVADPGADLLDLLLDDVGHGPGRLQAGDVEQEVLEHRVPVRGGAPPAGALRPV